ncbi:MAG: nucleotidyltransferase domain-containing protein [Candidatus Eisenbacteria sp.]|nr:nucleotidyltransferase domain-containing protein [Candidatus Eisenbacteria bacterium]
MLLRPEREWYRSELACELGVPASSLQRPLARLRETEILSGRRSGNRTYYRANTENPVFPELRGVLAKTSGLAWILREALEALAEKIAMAFVYGSIAAGEQVSSSDVDLFVVGKVGLAELAPLLRQAAMQLGREVNPTVYTEAEFTKRVRSRNHFLRSVLDKPKLFVVGTENDLRKACRPKETGRGADGAR